MFKTLIQVFVIIVLVITLAYTFHVAVNASIANVELSEDLSYCVNNVLGDLCVRIALHDYRANLTNRLGGIMGTFVYDLTLSLGEELYNATA